MRQLMLCGLVRRAGVDKSAFFENHAPNLIPGVKKETHMKAAILMLAICLSLAAVSCSNDDSKPAAP
ncbi:MAG: hypothetical protein RDU30_10935, partial [Desulfovibrionaceae bacterium]|nr:hypothetical protein [Desulfovibrionaceae bacterium]